MEWLKERIGPLFKMARTMMKEKGLPNEFWGEGVATKVYLINRCSTKDVDDRIPMEA